MNKQQTWEAIVSIAPPHGRCHEPKHVYNASSQKINEDNYLRVHYHKLHKLKTRRRQKRINIGQSNVILSLLALPCSRITQTQLSRACHSCMFCFPPTSMAGPIKTCPPIGLPITCLTSNSLDYFRVFDPQLGVSLAK